MNTMKTVVLACAALASSFLRASSVELNDGWLYVGDEGLAPSREFSIPSMLEMLDGQRRDLIEMPGASPVEEATIKVEE